MRASRMASVFDRFFISSQDWRLTYQHATRMRRALAQPSQQPTVADLRIEARLDDTRSAGQRIEGSLPGSGCACTFAGFGLSLDAFLLLCEAFLNDLSAAFSGRGRTRDILYHISSSFTGAGLDQDGGFGNITPYLGSEQKFFFAITNNQTHACSCCAGGLPPVPDKQSFQRAHRPSVFPSSSNV